MARVVQEMTAIGVYGSETCSGCDRFLERGETMSAVESKSGEKLGWFCYQCLAEWKGDPMSNDPCPLARTGQCCCVCKWRLTDYHHCQTEPEMWLKKDKCVCSEVAGYICVCPEIYEGKGGSSNWPEHSIGCECFQRREASKQDGIQT